MFHGFQFVLKIIKKRPLRMCLTLLQVAAGVASIAIVLSFVFSMLTTETKVNTKVLIQMGEEISMDGRVTRRFSGLFTKDMVKGFEEECELMDYLSVQTSSYRANIVYDGLAYLTGEVLGVGPDYQKISDLKMVEGYFFTNADLESDNRVIVISQQASEELFGRENPVGKTIQMGRGMDSTFENLKVIGVYSRSGQTNGFGEFPHFIVPYQFLEYKPQYPGSTYEPYYSELVALVKTDELTAFKDEMQMLFQQKYRDQINQSYIRNIDNLSLIFTAQDNDQMQSRQEVGKTFGLFIGAFAFVAIVVSSIGILSMMLVSVVERTREIGLRRSLGASRGNIIGQILAESMMLSFLGGIVGIILAFILVEPIINELILNTLFREFLGVSAKVSFYPIVISLAGILFVGLIAGIYPGIQASRLLPVDAIKES